MSPRSTRNRSHAKGCGVTLDLARTSQTCGGEMSNKIYIIVSNGGRRVTAIWLPASPDQPFGRSEAQAKLHRFRYGAPW